MQWPDGWSPIDDPEVARGLERALQSEVKAGHALFGLQLTAIARRHDQDDVLFEFQDGTKRLAQVHLTFAEFNAPPFPWTCVFKNAEDWAGSIENE